MIGYVEDDEEEDDFWENAGKEKVPTMKLEGRRIRVAGREVLLMGGATRGPLGSNNLVRVVANRVLAISKLFWAVILMDLTSTHRPLIFSSAIFFDEYIGLPCMFSG